MQEQLAALADASRWRIIELLAEQPRSVGVVAELCRLRQPQATKHLQTLERAGLATSRRAGHRRIYAVETEALRALVRELGRVADLAVAHREVRERFDQYIVAVDSETHAADHDRWADGREYLLSRTLPADRRTVWNYITDPTLLPRWWTTKDLRLSRIRFGVTPGEPVVQEYVDVDDRSSPGEVIGRAEGVVDEVAELDHIAFRLSPLLPDGTVAFTAHYEWKLSEAIGGTGFEVRLRISDSTAPSAEFVAGIQLGWDQSLANLAAILSTDTDTDTTKE